MESSRNTQCVNNLRQIGAAVLAFAADNNGMIPSDQAASSDFGSTSRQRFWSRKLLEDPMGSGWPSGYLPQATQPNGRVITNYHTSPIWYCPSSRVPTPDSPLRQEWTIYGYMRFQIPGGSPPNFSGGYASRYKPLAAIERPSEFPLIADSSQNTNNRPIYRLGGVNNAERNRYLFHFRHNGAANVWFLDGHVGKVDFDRLQELSEENRSYFGGTIFGTYDGRTTATGSPD